MSNRIRLSSGWLFPLCSWVALTVFVCLPSRVRALETVTPQEAESVARSWLFSYVGAFGDWGGSDQPTVRALRPLTDVAAGDGPIAFVAEIEPSGHVLVAGCRELPPVKSYSVTTPFRVEAGAEPESYESWVVTGLVTAFRGLQAAAAAPQRSLVDPGTNYAAWGVFLGSGGRGFTSGVPGIQFVRRAPLLDRVEFQGVAQPLQWNQTAPFNTKAPLMRTLPEEIWADLDGGGLYTGGDFQVYDIDLTWETKSLVAGSQAGLYYNDALVVDSAYTTDEDIWRDHPDGTPGVFDLGLDDEVFAGTDGWHTDDGTPGRQDNLYYTDADGSLDYTLWYGHALTGCVATAMAQVMRFWSWPDVGRNSHTYQWAYFEDTAHQDQTVPLSADFTHPYVWRIMPLNLVSTYPKASQDAVAQLMFDLGVCFEMDFGRKESGALLSQEQAARFARNFSYNAAGIQYVTRATELDDLGWFLTLQAELDARRPAVLSVRTPEKGHAIVVDGYDKLLGDAQLYMLHCNMGWGGTNDAYYTLDNVNGLPGGIFKEEYGEVQEQSALINILPTRTPDVVVAEVLRNASDPDAAVFSRALQETAARYGTDQLVALTYHVDAAAGSPRHLYPAAAARANRLTQAGLTASPPTAVLNGSGTGTVSGDGVGPQSAYSQRLQAAALAKLHTRVSYRVVGDCVIGVPPATPTGRPYFRADVYVSNLDDTSPLWDNLTLSVLLVESFTENATVCQWMVRDVVHESAGLRVASGETLIVSIPPMSPDAGIDLANAQAVAVLENPVDGSILQAAKLQAVAPASPDLRNTTPVAPATATITRRADGNQLLCSPNGAYDPDGDRITYVFDWYCVNPDGSGGQTGLTAATVDSPGDWAFAVGQLWYCEVRARDPFYNPADPPRVRAKHESQPTLSNPLLILDPPGSNRAPSSPTVVVLSPGQPTDADDILCLASGAADPDGDPVTYLFQWFRNGVLVAGQTEALLAAEQTTETDPQQQWFCRVTARDLWGAESGPADSAAVSIGPARGREPTKPLFAMVSPAVPSYTSTLVCSDPTGVSCPDPWEAWFHWWKKTGDSWLPTDRVGTKAQGMNTLPVPRIGELWRCLVYARNTVTGANGPALVTNAVLVRNLAPTKPTPAVYPAIAGVDEALTCNVAGSSDPEGGEVTYHFEWLVNGESSGLTSQTVPVGVTASGQSWVCRVYAQDPLGARSAIAETGVAHVGNRPTAPHSVQISPTRPEDEDDLVCIAQGSTDQDGDEVTYTYRWYKEGSYVSDLTGPIVPASLTTMYSRLYIEDWYCVVRATDGLLSSPPVASNTVHIGNLPPSPPVISLAPAQPKAGQSIECSIVTPSEDPEGDPIVYVFNWYLNDTVTAHTNAVLPAGITQIGETWKCIVYAQDNPQGTIPRARSDSVTTPELSFVSMAPTSPTTVVIRPSAPRDSSDLVCAASGARDPNGDPITYLFEWYRRPVAPAGAPFAKFEAPEFAAAYRLGTMPAAATALGEQWYCSVVAQDSKSETSLPVRSNVVVIQNVAPTVPVTVVVTPDPAGVGDDLICSPGGAEDPNGDTIRYWFQWFRNGTAVGPASPDAYRVLATQLVRGDAWYCEAWASDEEGLTSDRVRSNTVTIRNLAPTRPASVTIAPPVRTDVDDLICVAQGSSDPEGGAVTYAYLWFRNGAATDFVGQALRADATAIGEVWTCSARAVDSEGVAGEPVVSEAVTIVTPAPSAPAAAVTPTDPATTDELTCTVTDALDPYGGTLTSVFRWYRKQGAGAWMEQVQLRNSATVSHTLLARGDVWSCTVYVVSDHGYQSVAVTSNEVSVVNHAPLPPTVVRVTPDNPGPGGTLTCTPTGASDRDADPLTYAYRWQKYDSTTRRWVNSGTDVGQAVQQDLGDVGSFWRCLVSVSDGERVSPEILSNLAQVTAGGPVAPAAPDSIALFPVAAAAGEELLCLPSGPAHVFTYRIQWSRDGVDQPQYSQAVIPYGVTRAGEVWRCDVWSRNAAGLESATTARAETQVLAARQSPPSKPVHVAVTPEAPSYLSKLRCSRPAGVTPEEAVPQYRWERQTGDLWVPGTTTTPEVELSALPADDLIGSRWRCRAYALNPDTGANGESLLSNEVVVQNFPPSAPSVIVSPQFASLQEALSCFASGASDKEDGTAVTYYYEWFVDGKASGLTGGGLGLTHQVLPAGYTSTGELWTCRVYAEDSRGARGPRVTSANSTYIGTAPTAPARVPVSPARPEDVDDITCTASGSTDADGDAITYRYEWYKEEVIPFGMSVPTQLVVLPANAPGCYWKQTFSGAVLAASLTSFGDRWVCVVYATDGTLTSAPIGSEPVRIGNQPPTRPAVAVTPDRAVPGEALTCSVLAESTDPESDAFTYSFRWFRNQEPAPAYAGQALPAGTTQAGETWFCEVTVTDLWIPAASNVVRSVVLYFRAAPPSKPTEVFIEPLAPKLNDSRGLVCVARGAVDPNGDPVHYEFTWYKDGVRQNYPLDTSVIPPSALDNDGGTWSCSVVAADNGGLRSEPVDSAAVSVGNRPPSAPASVSIAPNPAGTAADLVCSPAGSVDPNGDPVTYLFQWQRNGIDDPDEQDYLLPRTRLVRGDVWTCAVRATDGVLTSLPTLSSQVTIQNLPPTKPATVTITPAAPTDIADLICVATGVEDPEGRAVTYAYQWFRNGLATAHQGSRVPAVDTQIGESWACEARAFDNDPLDGKWGEARRSGTVTIRSPAPSAPQVKVTPEDPHRLDDLTCAAAGSVDPLGGQVEYVHRWHVRRGGTWLETNETEAVVPAGRLLAGDLWKCAVYARNGAGFVSETVTSNEVLVANHAPAPPKSVVLTPIADGPGSAIVALQCQVETEPDPDADAITLLYRWQTYAGDGQWQDVAGQTTQTAAINTQGLWRCLVSVTDADLTSPAVASNPVRVPSVAGVKPAAPVGVTLTPATPVAGEQILCFAGTGVDAGGEALTYRYSWLRNGVLQTAHSTAVLPANHTVAGERWACAVRAVDIWGVESDPAMSPEVAVSAGAGALPPVPVAVVVTPALPSYNSVLHCSEPTGVDGYTVVRRWWRQVGSTWHPTGFTDSDVAMSPAEIGHYWRCTVAAQDQNQVTGPWLASVAVLIVNKPPSKPSVTVAANSVRITEDIRCFPGGSVDPENETATEKKPITYAYQWLVNGEPSGLRGAVESTGTAVPTVDHRYLSPNSVWTCRVVALDWLGEPSEVAISAGVRVGGVPSAPTSLTVTPKRPEPGQELRAVADGAKDPDGDPVSYVYGWTGDIEGADIVLWGDTLPASSVGENDEWFCVAWATDGTLNPDGTLALSPRLVSGKIRVGNRAPYLFEVTVEPAVPLAGEAMTCAVLEPAQTDVDGDRVTYSFSWLRTTDQVPVYVGATLPRGMSQLGETWYCEVVARDDYLPQYTKSTVSRSRLISFAQAAPTPPSEVFLQPAAPKPGQTLACIARGSQDPNSDPVHYLFAWYRNNSLTTMTADRVVLDPAAPAGETWRCEVKAADPGGLESPAVSSQQVTVRDLPPSAPSSVLVSPDPAGTNLDLLCTAGGSVDPNDDPVTYRFQWNQGGIVEVGATDYRLPKARLARGQTWVCEVTATAAGLSSAPVASNPVLIQNLPPTRPASVLILPAQPTELDDLLCVASGSSDAEGQPVTYVYQWYRNGAATMHQASRVRAADTNSGETWTCEVRAVDGDATDPRRSEPARATDVLVRSAAPSAPTVRVTPEDATRRTELTCIPVGSVDPLGGAIEYEFRWYVQRQGAWSETGETAGVIPAVALLAGDIWKCVVWGRNSVGFTSAAVVSNEVTIANHAPVPPTQVLISPVANPDGTAIVGLHCTVATETDPDADALTFAFRWESYAGDGQWQPVPGQTADSLAVAGPGVWRCLVTVSDGDRLSPEVASNPIRVAPPGARPSAPANPVLTPTQPVAGEEILCLAGPGLDPAGEVVTYRYRWLRNGVPQPAQAAAILRAGQTAAGERWSCEVRAVDAWGIESDAARAPEVTIRSAAGALPPRPVFVAVNPRDPSYNSVLTCSEPTGTDGYTVVRRWWRLAGNTWYPSTATGPQLAMGVEQIGYYWRCSVAAQDQNGTTGPWLDSEAVLVVNRPPSRPSVIVSGSTARATDDLRCYPSGSVDPENETAAEKKPITYAYEWEVNGVPSGVKGAVDSASGAVPTVLSRYLYPNSLWTCRVVAVDWLGQASEEAVSSPIRVGGAPSAPTTVTISPSRPEPGEDLRAVASGSQDPDNDRVTYVYGWTRDPTGLLIAAWGDVLPGVFTFAGNEWYCVVWATDGSLNADGSQALSPKFISGKVLVGNRAPGNFDVSISPDVPAAGQALTCAVVSPAATDPDGDLVTFTFSWFRTTDAVAAYTGSTLPGGMTQAGEMWFCEVTARDDHAPQQTRTTRSRLVSFVAVPPTAPTEVRLEPGVPKPGQALVCIARGAQDPNQDPIHYVFAWYRNHALTTDTDDTVAILPTAPAGETWRCEVKAVDAGGLASPSAASQQVVVGDLPPTAPTSVVISPDPAGTNADLVCVAGGSVDPNEDPVVYLYQWQRNGVDEPGATGYHLPKSKLVRGDTWRCAVRAQGGAVTSGATLSNPVTIGNLAPSRPALALILPAQPTELDDLVCVASGASDPERRVVTYLYQWYRNGAATTHQTARVANADTQPGESWTCEVRALDNDPLDPRRSDATTSPAVLVRAATPSAPTVRVTPVNPTRRDDLTCTAEGSVDPLGGSVEYVFRWYVKRNGVWAETADAVPVIASASLLADDVWKCVVYAHSLAGFVSDTVVSNEVAVANHTPRAPLSVVIIPVLLGGAGGNIRLQSATLYEVDPDADEVTLLHRWQTYLGDGQWRDSGDYGAVVENTAADGTAWRCLVASTDGELTSPEVASNVVRVTGAGPSVPSAPVFALIEPLEPGAGEELLCLAGGATDAGGGPLTYVYRWFRRGAAQPQFVLQSDYTSPILPFGVTQPGEQWYCEVRARDQWGVEGPATATPTVALAQTSTFPPAPGNVTVTPVVASYAAELACSTPTRVDGYEVHYRWWQQVGDIWVPTSHIGPSLQVTAAEIGQYWRCSVVARDRSTGVYGPSILSNAVLIVNEAPSAPIVAVYPRTARLRDTLTCQAGGAIDPEEGEVGVRYFFQWLVNGVDAGISGEGANRVTDQYLYSGSVWQCRVTAVDKYGASSATVVTETVRVGSPPTVPLYAIVSPVRPGENDDVRATAYGSTDTDNDPITYSYVWVREEKPEGKDTSEWVPRVYGAVLPAAVTHDGEDWKCRIWASDGTYELDGTPSLSPILEVGPLHIGNRPPTKPEVDISPKPPLFGQPVECVVTNVEEKDADEDRVNYEYAWFKMGVAEPLYRGKILPPELVHEDDTWTCRVTAYDDWIPSATAVALSPSIVFRDVPPTAPAEVFIQPVVPKDSDDLVCIARGASDPNGEQVYYRFTWYKNGVAQSYPNDTSRVPAADTRDGEVWHCTAVAVDSKGQMGQPTDSAPVTIGNRPPSPPVFTQITPAQAGTGADLVCTVSGAVDPNGDAILYQFQWLKAGAIVPGATEYRLPKTLLQVGDLWSCQVRATDGLLASAWVVTNTVRIENLAPSKPTSVQIIPVRPTDIDDLVCVAVGSVDPEGRTITYSYQWFRNGAHTDLTGQRVPAENSGIGDVWTCEVRAQDNDPVSPRSSEAVMSPAVGVVSPAPTAPTVNVTPQDPSRRDTLVCEAKDSLDPLGGQVTYVYSWSLKRGGLWQDAGIASAAVPSANLSNGDTWKCSVRATNAKGFSSDMVASNEVVVTNHAPAAPTAVVLSPLVPVLGGSLTCFASGAVDRDGDPISYEFRWEHDGGTGNWVLTANTVQTVTNLANDGYAWRCRVVAFDGDQRSPVVVSPEVRVTGHAPTAPTSVAIAKAGGDLVCTASGSTDADGDSLLYVFTWYRNANRLEVGIGGVGTAEASGAWTHRVSATLTAEGEEWHCRVEVHDARGAVGPSAWAAPYTVQNHAPVAPTQVALAPANPTPNNAIRCLVTPAAPALDADGDTVAYVFRWFKNGVEQIQYAGPLLPDLATAQGDRWACQVVARDSFGAATAAVTSGEVVVGSPGLDPFEDDNSPDTASALVLNPEKPRVQSLPANDVDWSWFVVDGLSEVRLLATVVSGGSVQLSLFARADLATPLFQDTGEISRILQPGFYYLRVTGAGAPVYKLEFTAAAARAMGTAADVNGAQTAVDPVDWFFFSLPAPADVALRATPVQGTASLVLTLYTANYRNAYAETEPDRITQRLQAGLHYVSVKGQSIPTPGTLTYRLNLAAGGAVLTPNQAPFAPTVVKLFPASAVDTTRLHAVAYGARDPDENQPPPTVHLRWSQNGLYRPEFDDATEIDGAYVEEGDTWSFQAVARDVFLVASQAVASEDVLVGAVDDWSLAIGVQATAHAELVVGQSRLATNGWDEGIDDVTPPLGLPAQDRVFIEGPATDALHATLSRDLRSQKGTIQHWYIQVSDKTNVRLAWDAADLPVGLTLVLAELDPAGSVIAGTEVDMRQVRELSLAGASRPAPRYRIMAVRGDNTFEQLDLLPGRWNLISFTLQGIDDSVDNIFSGLNTGSVWAFDSTTGQYEAVTTVTPGRGYWVLCPAVADPAQTTVTVRHVGAVDILGRVHLGKGWNLVGPARSCLVPQVATIVREAVYGYDPLTSSYQRADLLKANAGYWIYTTEATVVDLR